MRSQRVVESGESPFLFAQRNFSRSLKLILLRPLLNGTHECSSRMAFWNLLSTAANANIECSLREDFCLLRFCCLKQTGSGSHFITMCAKKPAFRILQNG